MKSQGKHVLFVEIFALRTHLEDISYNKVCEE